MHIRFVSNLENVYCTNDEYSQGTTSSSWPARRRLTIDSRDPAQVCIMATLQIDA